MLLYFQALVVGVPADEVNLRVGQPLSGQSGEHLMAEQVRVLPQVCHLLVMRHSLLDPASGVFRSLPRLEQVAVPGIGTRNFRISLNESGNRM